MQVVGGGIKVEPTILQFCEHLIGHGVSIQGCFSLLHYSEGISGESWSVRKSKQILFIPEPDWLAVVVVVVFSPRHNFLVCLHLESSHCGTSPGQGESADDDLFEQCRQSWEGWGMWEELAECEGMR